MLIKINPENPESKKIEMVIDTLKNGGILVYPTDTIYGLGCDIFNKNAVNKIYQIKKRDGNKPMSIICSSISEISEYALIPNDIFMILKKFLPGPFTFILKAKSKTPSNFISKNKTVGIRIPDNKICMEITKKMGNPIITTSLNISGQEVMTSPSQLSKELKNKIDLIIDNGPLPQEASTIVDLSSKPFAILRQGKGQFIIN